MSTYTDKKGYPRHSNLVHRQKAYEQIYLKNRHKYPLPFSDYVIHHRDGNKKNSNIDNLEILTPEEHAKVHGFNVSAYSEAQSYSFSHSDLKRFHILFFHGFAWVAFSLIMTFVFFKITNYAGFETDNFLLFATGFFLDSWTTVVSLIIAYILLVSWWIEPIRRSLQKNRRR